MQGTIKEYDRASGTGSLLTDDSEEIVIDERSLDEVIRTLRFGQRVRFEVTETDGRQVARSLRIVTFD